MIHSITSSQSSIDEHRCVTWEMRPKLLYDRLLKCGHGRSRSGKLEASRSWPSVVRRIRWRRRGLRDGQTNFRKSERLDALLKHVGRTLWTYLKYVERLQIKKRTVYQRLQPRCRVSSKPHLFSVRSCTIFWSFIHPEIVSFQHLQVALLLRSSPS